MPVPFLAAALVAPLAIAAPAKDEESVRAFMAWIYSHYRDEGRGAPLGTPELLFEPALAAAIRKDAEAAAAAGEMSKMDADPFCDCQDFAGMNSPMIADIAIDGDRATASATIMFGTNGYNVTHVAYRLVWTARGWRIFDMTWNGNGATLRAMYLPDG